MGICLRQWGAGGLTLIGASPLAAWASPGYNPKNETATHNVTAFINLLHGQSSLMILWLEIDCCVEAIFVHADATTRAEAMTQAAVLGKAFTGKL
jgi:hypothetical protein